MILALVPAPASAEPGMLSTEIDFANGGVTLHGTIITPPGKPTNRPGVVMVAGAGAVSRDAYRAEAEAFARAGIVVLVYDKRAGYSRATSQFADLADDAIAGLRALRAQPEVDPARVGLWGHSQGGWVAPLAATRSAEVGFVVTVAASGLDTGRTQLWSNRAHLSHAGVADRLIPPIGSNLSRLLMSAGLFGDTGHDPLATLTKVRQPLLGVFADHDRSTAPGESLTAFKQALDTGGNTRYSLRVVKDANHNLRHSADGYDKSKGDFAPGYLDLVTSWINGLAAGPATGVDPPPAQPSLSAAVPPPAWYEAVWPHVASILLMLLAFLAYPVSALVRRVRGRRTELPVRLPARLLVVSGLVVVLGTLFYLFRIVQTGAIGIGPVMLGRPVVWLVLQAVTLVALVASAATAAAWYRERRALGGSTRLRLAILVAGSVVFVPWAAYWGLLLP
ncbi:alpha/beta hydrolase family protein [Actinokineospora sp. HUAS TT18]|uniref:alpha/beta hydrolase family protein n=1 Tax=Actinokineospora sp. HUAS TT18 TaxID=3447451 RepID=UPI003F524B4B